MKKQIDESLRRRYFLGEREQGFERKMSCITSFLSFYNKVKTSLVKGESVDSMTLDYRRTCDTSPQRKLGEEGNSSGGMKFTYVNRHK